MSKKARQIYLSNDHRRHPYVDPPTCGWDEIAHHLYSLPPAAARLVVYRESSRLLVVAEIEDTVYVLGEADAPDEANVPDE